jgi:hypothetical protein
MLLEKEFCVTVDVADVCNFCANKGPLLMAALHDEYAGRCYMGCYIIEIVEIIMASACHLITTNSSAEGYIEVKFMARVAVFSQWDILVGVEVMMNEKMLIGVHGDKVRKTGLATVALLPSKAVEALAVGQQIAVRVVVAGHTPMQERASVYAVLLTCDAAAQVYRLRGALDKAASAELAPMLAAVETELAAREELVATRRADLWFFELLLYSYRARRAGTGTDSQTLPAWEGGPSWEGPPALVPHAEGCAVRNVLDIVRKVVHDGESVPVTGAWSRPLNLYRSSPLAAVADGRHLPAGWIAATESAPRVVFALFLKNILDFLVATRELAQLYSTEELVRKHFALWAAMRAAQTPVD